MLFRSGEGRALVEPAHVQHGFQHLHVDAVAGRCAEGAAECGQCAGVAFDGHHGVAVLAEQHGAGGDRGAFGGDAAEALHWLTQLDNEYQLTNDNYGIGDFIEDLKKKGAI